MNKMGRNYLPQVISVRCKSIKKKGGCCKNRTKRTRKCWVHLQQKNNLHVKKSNIPNAGFGLLARQKAIKRGERIGKYTSGRISSHKLDQYYGEGNLAPYAYCDSDERKASCINANLSMDGALRYANDGRRPNENNMIMKNIPLGRYKFSPVGFASKRIDLGKEIYWNYGKYYWKS